VKRLVACAVGSYLLVALFGMVMEGLGARQCGCSQECWCHKPGLSLFRWVFPVGHLGSEQDKRTADTAS
jgi:hypothetical protein